MLTVQLFPRHRTIEAFQDTAEALILKMDAVCTTFHRMAAGHFVFDSFLSDLATYEHTCVEESHIYQAFVNFQLVNLPPHFISKV